MRKNGLEKSLPPESRHHLDDDALFRSEAIEYAGNRLLGSPMDAKPGIQQILIAIQLLAVCAVILLLITASHTENLKVHGWLTPPGGIVKIQSSQDGIITRRYVSEGQVVKAGDNLYEIADDKTSPEHAHTGQYMSDQLRLQIGSLQRDEQRLSEQLKEQNAAAREKITGLEYQKSMLERQLALMTEQAQLARTTLQSMTELEADRLVSRLQVDAKHSEQLELEARVAQFARDKSVMTGEIADLRQQIQTREIQEKREEDADARNVESLSLDLAANEVTRRIVIQSPIDASITSIYGTAGHSVKSSELLALAVPASTNLEAILYVPSRNIGVVKPDQRVLLRYDALPYQSFGQAGGRITEVSRAPVVPADMPPSDVISRIAVTEPVYKVTVQLDSQSLSANGRVYPLKAGSLLEASISLERRKIYEWLLDPFHAIWRKVS